MQKEYRVLISGYLEKDEQIARSHIEGNEGQDFAVVLYSIFLNIAEAIDGNVFELLDELKETFKELATTYGKVEEGAESE